MPENFEGFKPSSPESRLSPEINGEELTEVLSAESYTKKLQLAWKYSLESDTETGFAVGKNIESGKFKIGKIFGQGRDAKLGNVAIESLGKDFDKRGDAVLVGHTHPNDSFYPSYEDIKALFYTRSSWRMRRTPANAEDYNYYPVELILAAPEDKMREQVDILMFQEKRKDSYREAEHARAMENWLTNSIDSRDYHDHPTIAATIDQSPFLQATMFSYDRDPKSGKVTPQFSKEELLKKMEKFGY